MDGWIDEKTLLYLYSISRPRTRSIFVVLNVFIAGIRVEIELGLVVSACRDPG
jgi:hypothetical protein